MSDGPIIGSTDPEDHEWIFLGSKTVYEAYKRIALPEGVFESGLLDKPEDEGEYKVHWSYEEGAGIIILSDEKLTGRPIYRHINSVKQGGPGQNYSVRVPSFFFSDSAGGQSEIDERVPEKARVEYGEERHFVTRQDFLEADKKSCFLLTKTQFEGMIGSYRDDLEDSVAPIPRFLDEQ